MKVHIGIDWSENKHDICWMHETGEVLLVQQIPHTIAGFRQLDQARDSLGVGRQELSSMPLDKTYPTRGSLRVFRQFVWLKVGSGKVALSRPAHRRVTQAVGR